MGFCFLLPDSYVIKFSKVNARFALIGIQTLLWLDYWDRGDKIYGRMMKHGATVGVPVTVSDSPLLIEHPQPAVRQLTQTYVFTTCYDYDTSSPPRSPCNG